MDCGIPFCHNGCPTGQSDPEWNDLVRTARWREPSNGCTPPTTSRTSPAGCVRRRANGVRARHQPDPVTIKQIELEIIDKAFDEGFVQPLPADKLTGKTVAVVGSARQVWRPRSN